MRTVDSDYIAQWARVNTDDNGTYITTIFTEHITHGYTHTHTHTSSQYNVVRCRARARPHGLLGNYWPPALPTDRATVPLLLTAFTQGRTPQILTRTTLTEQFIGIFYIVRFRETFTHIVSNTTDYSRKEQNGFWVFNLILIDKNIIIYIYIHIKNKLKQTKSKQKPKTHDKKNLQSTTCTYDSFFPGGQLRH